MARSGRRRATVLRWTAAGLLLVGAVGIGAAAPSGVVHTLDRLVEVRPFPLWAGRRDFILIDKSRNELTYYRDGLLVKSYPVATGRRPEYTPEGSFRIVFKAEDPGADPRLGERWMGLGVPPGADRRGPPGDPRGPAGRKYGIHGTNEPASIGEHASAGCVRMQNADVVELYELVPEGTPVVIRP